MDESRLRELLVALVGQKAWGANLGIGSFLRLNFGPVAHFPDGHPRGEWFLWTYMCSWRLDANHQILVGSEDARQKIRGVIQMMNDKAVQAVELRVPSLELTVKFEGNLTLNLFPTSSEDDDHWMLWLPGSDVLTAGPGSTWAVEPEDTQGILTPHVAQQRSSFDAGFHLRGDFDPDDITSLVGIAPTATWRGKGKNDQATARKGRSRWTLRSPLPHSEPIEEHVQAVLALLTPSWERFRELGQQYQGEFTCTGELYGNYSPDTEHTTDTLKRITELNADVRFVISASEQAWPI